MNIRPSPGAFFFGLLLCTLCATTSDGAPLFPDPIFDAGPIPDSVVLADFNRDGLLDAAVSDTNSNDVSVYLGNGDGTMGAATRFPAGTGPTVLVTADFNRDSFADLAVLDSSYPYGANILFGRGDGTFQSPVQVDASYRLVMATADMNGDGAPDLVLAGADPTLCVLTNRGDGSLSPAVCQSTVNAVASLAVGDFNHDGRPDVAVGGNSGIVLHLGTGGGALTAPNPIASTLYNLSLAAADFNRDGKLDLVTGSGTLPPNARTIAVVLIGDGNGGFSPVDPSTQIGTTNNQFVTTGDFNGDGIPDLATSGQGGFAVLPGVGDGTFGPGRGYSAGERAPSLAVGDINRDGHFDIVATVLGSSGRSGPTSVDGLAVYLGARDGTFGQPGFGTGYALGGIGRADVNGDGHADLVLVETFSDRVSVMLGRGNGTFADPVPYPTDDGPKGVVFGDFNRDGRIDMATAVTSGVDVLLGAGDGTFSPPAYYVDGERHDSIVTADFDGDGILDLAVPDSQSNYNILIYRGIGDGTFIPFSRYIAGFNPQGLAAGDVDGDGIPDLVASVASSNTTGPGTGGLALLHGLGDCSFAAPVFLLWGPLPKVVLVADLNADGHADLLATGDGNDEVSVFLGLGGGAFGARLALPAGDGPSSLAVGDVTGDGHLDIVLGDADSVDVAVLRGDGAGGFAPRERFSTLYPYGVALGDFDEDGDQDIAVGSSGTAVTILRNSTVPPRAPTARAGPDHSVECSSPAGALVPLDGSASSDPDSTPGTNDDIVDFRWFEGYGTAAQTLLGTGRTTGVTLALGPHTITLQVTDTTDLQSTDDVVITVADTQPPVVTVALAPSPLWPPNHRLVPVTASLSVVEVCGSVTITLESVTSSEPDDAPGGADGATTGDIQGAEIGTGDLGFLLRAERAADGPGRTYTATYRVTDAAGHSAPGVGVATVPHDLDGVTDPVTIRLSETPAGTLVSWDPVPGAESYDVAVGDLAALVSFNPIYGAFPPMCLAPRLLATNTAGFEVPDLPGVGEGYFFVVSYRMPAPSGYGSESGPYDLDQVVPESLCP